MIVDIHVLAAQSFLKLVSQRLVAKGVLSQAEVADLYDAWFRDVLALGAEFEAEGEERDVDGILHMIHSLTEEFTPK